MINNNIVTCRYCGRIITNDEFKVTFENLGENKGNEEIVTGYTCYDCGYEENY